MSCVAFVCLVVSSTVLLVGSEVVLVTKSKVIRFQLREQSCEAGSGKLFWFRRRIFHPLPPTSPVIKSVQP